MSQPVLLPAVIHVQPDSITGRQRSRSRRPIAHGRGRWWVALIGLMVSLITLSQPAQAGRHDEMNYGPVLAGTFKTQFPAGNTVLKGLAIRLNPADAPRERQAAVLFDTELCRFAAWSAGGFVKFQGVVYDGGHGSNPSLDGQQRIGTRPMPGVAKPDSSASDPFADPRSIPHGPLPRSWSRYRGWYRHPAGPVLSYSAGALELLELPQVRWMEAEPVFTRQIQVSAGAEVTLLVAEVEQAKSSIDGNTARLEQGDQVTLVGFSSAPEGSRLLAQEGRIVLQVAGSAQPRRLQLTLLRGPKAKLADLQAQSALPLPAVDLDLVKKGSPAEWTKTVETQGKRTPDNAAYVVDQLTVPEENPYKSWMRIGGFDFFSDGRAAVSTWSGDVWIVSGIDDGLQKLVWKRMAAGLFHGLGLKIVKDEVYVLGRDQITRLQDFNQDGEADFYQCFNNDVLITENFHEFAYELQTDPEGNFYFIKGGPVKPGGQGWDKIVPHHGCLFKLSPDGEKLEVIARGFRAPNGIGLGPHGELTTGDNEGTWTPVVPLNWVRQHGFYGVPEFSDQSTPPTIRDNPLCWMPKNVDNSNGGQVWIPEQTFGPLSGQLLHMSYGTCSLFTVLKEEVGGQIQGGVLRLPLNFDSGICRARFYAPQNALFLSALRGWQSSASRDGGLYRVRYTGKPAYLATALHVQNEGISLTFSEPLDPATATDVDNYTLEQWNYRWTGSYGSPHFKVSKPSEQGHDEIDVDEAVLSDDGRTVTLKIAGLRPVMQMKIQYSQKAKDGQPVKGEIYNTINVVNGQRGEIHPGELKLVPLQ